MSNLDKLWVVFEYEVEMYHGTRRLLSRSEPEASIARNAIVESLLLHTRIITDILLDKGREPDDINLSILLTGLAIPTELKESLAKLRLVYGTAGQANTPCWTINKMLAHPTSLRGNFFDWGSTVNKLDPLTYQILEFIADLTGRQTLKNLLSGN